MQGLGPPRKAWNSDGPLPGWRWARPSSEHGRGAIPPEVRLHPRDIAAWMTQGCGGLLSEERPARRESSAEHEPSSVLVTHLQTKLPPEFGAAANNFRSHVGRKQVCSRRGGEPSPARATPPGAGAERPASSRQHLYCAILVARSDWPTAVTPRPCAQRWRRDWADVSFRLPGWCGYAAVRPCGTAVPLWNVVGNGFCVTVFMRKICVSPGPGKSHPRTTGSKQSDGREETKSNPNTSPELP